MEIGKVIKLKNWNFIRWTRKHDMKFNSSLCSFYKIMNTELHVQHCNKCLNVTVEENILCKKCGQMNVFIYNKDVRYP